jgi:outer membrane protein assembly factor BamB
MLLALLLAVTLPRLRGTAQLPPAEERRLAGVILSGEIRDTLGRLNAADRLIARKAWAAGVDEYLRLIEEGGDDLVPEESAEERIASTRRSVQLRRLCHLRIAALPPEALRHYRGRVDGQARRLFERGAAAHDLTMLRRLVDQFAGSRFARRALELLGDLAFEKGRFAQALGWWGVVTPLPSEGPAPSRDRLLPDSGENPAGVQARQVLALLFQGDLRSARAELAALHKLQGKASGWLAGRKGNYTALLQTLLDQRIRKGPLSPEEDDWPTFGGSPARTRVLDGSLSPELWADGPAWRVRLVPEGAGEEPAGEHPEPHSQPARRLAFYPVVTGGLILVADARLVQGFDLHTGRRVFRHEGKVPGRPGLDSLRLGLPAPRDLRYTLSVAGGRVYARLGAQFVVAQGRQGAVQGHSYLICLELPVGREGKEAGALRERWAVAARGEGPGRYAFEGAPLVVDGRVYAAESCRTGGRTRTAIACHDADSGVLLWRQEVCSTPDGGERLPRARHHLLTQAGTSVVYCTHSGAIVSLDAVSGKRLWGVRYPSRGPEAAGAGAALRDLAPCVAVGRRLLVAPLDSARILCLDVYTGRTLWEREGLEPVHMLGVSAGRLLFTTAQGVRALDAASGDDAGGWRQPAVGRLAPLGRGLLSAGWVLWPTEDPRLPVRALNDEDGTAQRGSLTLDPTRLHRLRAGNFALGRGWLVAADTGELVGYAPRARSESGARQKSK